MQSSLWLDISLSMWSLARFQHSLREEYMVATLKIFSYLKKYPKCRIIIDRNESNYVEDTIKLKLDFGPQCCKFKEEIDLKFLALLMDEIQTTIFAD